MTSVLGSPIETPLKAGGDHSPCYIMFVKMWTSSGVSRRVVDGLSELKAYLLNLPALAGAKGPRPRRTGTLAHRTTLPRTERRARSGSLRGPELSLGALHAVIGAGGFPFARPPTPSKPQAIGTSRSAPVRPHRRDGLPKHGTAHARAQSNALRGLSALPLLDQENAASRARTARCWRTRQEIRHNS